MSEPKHTPGPWRYCGQERGGCCCGHIWSTSADIHLATAHRKNEDMEITRDEMIANAALISAAPDLLEVLKELALYPVERDYVDSPCLKREDMSAVLAAIAKAEPEGRQP